MNIHIILPIVVIISTAVIVDSSGDKVVCYYGSWAVYRHGKGKFDVEDIDPNICTHVVYTFAGIQENGDIKVLDPYNDLPDNWGKDAYGRIGKLRLKNPNLKTLIAIGGWNEGSTKYSKVVNNDQLRANFVNSATNFVLKYGFNGFDLDWEYPNQRGGVPSDVSNYSKLLKEMRTAFDKHGLLLTAAVAAAEPSVSQSYEIPEIAKYLDFINVMTYDIHGSWEQTLGHNAPLVSRKDESETSKRYLNIQACIKYWIQKGAPPNKIVMGIPLYGRTFSLVNNKNIKPGDASNGPGRQGPYSGERGFMGYNEICEMSNSLAKYWDDEQMVPYAVQNNDWITYDDERSIYLKVQWAKQMGLGGAMVWSIETDDFHGICGRKNPLLNTIVETLNGNIPPQSTNATTASTISTGKTTNISTSTSEEPEIFTCKAKGYFVDPVDCNKYYYCQKVGNRFNMITLYCPSRLCYNEELNVCYYPK